MSCRRTAGPLRALFHRDGEGVAAFKEYGAFGEVAEADLRALKVGEEADAAAGFVGGLADVVVPLLVFGVAAVAEVEAGYVHSASTRALIWSYEWVAGPRVQTIFARRMFRP